MVPGFDIGDMNVWFVKNYLKEAKDGTTSLGTNSYYPVSAICEEDLEKTKECNVLKYNIFDENNIRRDIFLKKGTTGQYSCENFKGLRSSFESQFMLKKNNLKPFLSPLFHPYMYICGITDVWRKENDIKMFGNTSVIPRDANILFLHGRNDPVLNNEYVESFVQDIKSHQSPNASVTEKVFERSRHAMSVIDYPEEYKEFHVNHLLGKVPEWC